ncbi:hypothetical protein CKO28_23245 [Rhodovibrio sodomensis]|uniref:AMP-dependent synthetase/ligase domain-containing protein n=1 Tax=Rhodovibrio sodomensis TaxID=1088 RepID=A0ABS1DKD0_9PROT|nr:AMP-binding protein [Rhodovibrio sodomensis]MBK1670932.1 hypothetical protein [Rhodovibrio sodomensis]
MSMPPRETGSFENDYGSLNAAELSAYARRAAEHLFRAGIPHNARIGLCADNGPAWDVAQAACWRLGSSVVALDPALSASDLSATVTELNIRRVLTNRHDLGALPVPTVQLGTLELLADAPTRLADEPTGGLDDEAMVTFTSGTTSRPKAIAYSHRQLLEAIKRVADALGPIRQDDRTLCWLPMNNLFQRMMNLVSFQSNMRVFYKPFAVDVFTALKTVQPTIVIGVPRFYEKAVTLGEDDLGGRARLAITGSAASSRNVIRHFEDRGIALLEAYGVSESLVPIAANSSTERRQGSVGKPLPGNDVRIANTGEIEVRGPGVFTGYLGGEPARFDGNGFYSTGDRGYFDRDGFLYIDGRMDDVFKTSTGRKVDAARIETKLCSYASVNEAVVVGADRKVVTAIIVGRGDDPAGTIPEITRLNEELISYERIAGIVFSHRPFAETSGLKTTNGKLRKNAIVEHYSREIEELYQRLEEAGRQSTIFVKQVL